MKNDEMKIDDLEGIYSIEMVDLGMFLKWFKEILKLVRLKGEMISDTRERGHKMQKKAVNPVPDGRSP